ncbi:MULTISPECIES: carbon-nitrogen hydrolase family protein [Alcaligenaceae]|jgi:nitrilase|uniref:Aliphatic nitrilase n=1 Tax=Neopusillimonas maritima TaxID=2026239 RepID=A0A3A1YV56_9BURK|nr:MULTISPECIES: carbon-nitrogen hydrolase family protein [Alcaligenaceae]MAL01271.1 aliphatic nitrilase [Alcaligenaceae bacterium]QIM48244.1 carbon-nitrogen hydrolase family protein [Pusillimonas sp. DMV24BSW_D]RII83580.1 aliphatic nitrilase [Neopusillimonas maritima]RIY41426.1 aliphatic nitrilase [Neopusillimonas maritima]|tara:strand:+ start:201759 stop:202796 length:1038 start_codon:yes stop_codon:yes gene_type:complete
MLNLPQCKVAAVQAAPVFLDTDATVEKVCHLIKEAANKGAQLVAFPEVFIAGYPYWNWFMSPVEGSPWFEKLARSAIEIPGPEIHRVAQAAKANGVHVVVGVNERNRNGIGTIYNTLVFIGPDGKILGRHRKLIPTWAEKLTWANGDGASLRVYDTAIGKLGGLACGENTNTLARFSLLAQGELLHVASYISLPVAPPDYDMSEAIKVRAMAHSFEGKVYTVVSCSTVSDEIIQAFRSTHPQAEKMLRRKNSAFSGVIGPDGRVIGKPLIDKEGIVYADIDLSKCIQPRQMHDIVGHYNRFDIFDLRVNRLPQQSAQFIDTPAQESFDYEPDEISGNSHESDRRA